MPRSGPGPVMGDPEAKTLPVVGKFRPATMERMVDFPQPEGPRIETNWPSSMVMVVGAMMVVEP